MIGTIYFAETADKIIFIIHIFLLLERFFTDQLHGKLV